MEQKQEKSKQFFYQEGKTTLKGLVNYADAQIPGVLEQVAKVGLAVTGPMEFIYFGATGDVNNEFTLHIALPVAEQKIIPAPYQIKQVPEFKCLSVVHKGNIADIGATYDQVFAQIQAQKIVPNGEIREVYHLYKDHASAENVTEIQIGIA
jgi:predicted transcriptional regulator YdeE